MKNILSSAGTYGDFLRYLQMFPSVAFNNDESDDVLVRAETPMPEFPVFATEVGDEEWRERFCAAILSSGHRLK